MLVKDAMTAQIHTIQAGATLIEAAEQFLLAGAETLFVMEQDRLVGVIGLRDLFTAPVPAHYGGSMAAHRSEDQLVAAWKTIPVKHLMNEKFIYVTEDVPLLRAAERMVNTGKHPLPVMKDGRLIGSVSRNDIIRKVLAAGGDPTGS